jgi:hypothetical protein
MRDSDAAGTPGPAAHGQTSRSPDPGEWPGDGQVCLSEDDLLAVLDGLGVAGTHDPEDEQEAIAAAEWEALHDHECGARRDDRSIASQPSAASQRTASGQGSAAAPPGDDDGGSRAVSPVLIGEHLPAGPGLAALLASDPPGQASDWDLPGLAAGYRKLAAWAQARELAAAAEIAARRAAANPRIGTTEQGRPAALPPEAAAEIALELAMTQPGASAWTALGCQLRWDLPTTGAALAAGTIDLPRARIIADATAVLTTKHAAAVEARVLPHAAGQTTSQLRAAVRRAVLAIDPDGADQRRRDTERSARLTLYPGEEGTATLTGSCLPGLQAAAAMARITAIARALKVSGAHGGLDLLRAHVYLGLLTGTLPYIPPPPGSPPDNPSPPDHDEPSGPAADGCPGGPAGGAGPCGRAADGAPGRGGTTSDDGSPHSSGPASGMPDGGSPSGEAPADPALASPAPGSPGPAPDGSDPASGVGDVSPRGEEDLPDWWPEIPPPGDADAPPDDGDPPDPVPVPASDPDDFDDDWPQLPPPDWPTLPAHLPAPPGPAPSPDGGGQPGASLLARTGLLDVLIPWTTLTGHGCEPAILGRIGPVSSCQARELLALATRSQTTQWRVILTGDDGRALAVCRARPPRHPRARDTRPGMTGVIGRITITIRASTLGTPNAAPGPDSPLTVQNIAPAILAAVARALHHACAQTGPDPDPGPSPAEACRHAMATDAYRPPTRIREHIAARDHTCRFGPCGQPAWRTDLDHTLPWHKGGPTCPCNLGGFCRTHHQIKQLPGWHIHQPQPGTFQWTTPAGRTYQVTPDPYPV